MKLANRNILLISPEPWSQLFVSKHHYAIHLAKKGNRVFFLNPPAMVSQIAATGYSGVHIMDYRGFPKGMRYLPSFMARWFTQRTFRKLEHLAKVRFDMIWSFDNSVFFQLDALPKNVFCVSHIVDLNMDFETARAAKTASICFCNSTSIKSRLERFSNKVHFVNHGLSILNESSSNPVHLNYQSGTNVGYSGNLDIKYLDWKLIQQVSNKHPEINFYFAGTLTSKATKSIIERSSNMHHIGVLPANEIQSFYEQMDVLILAYYANEFKDQLANPHKVLEYLYSGKPIVATYTAEYADKNLLYMSGRNEEWPNLFAQVVNNLAEYSTPELAAKRRAFALDNTYEKQIERIEKILADQGFT